MATARSTSPGSTLATGTARRGKYTLVTSGALLSRLPRGRVQRHREVRPQREAGEREHEERDAVARDVGQPPEDEREDGCADEGLHH